MDNLSSHKSAAAVEAIEAVGAEVVDLPPYPPDVNPIENIRCKVKQLIRGLKHEKSKQHRRCSCKGLGYDHSRRPTCYLCPLRIGHHVKKKVGLAFKLAAIGQIAGE